MRLTAFGLKSSAFYIAVLATYFAAPYSNLFFLLLGFLTLTGLSCLLSTQRNMRGVEANLTSLRPIVAGTRSTSPLTFRATKRSAFHVTARIELESKACLEGHTAFVQGEQDSELVAPPLPRGIHPVRRAFVASTYPMGLFRKRRVIDAPKEIVVYPRPTELVSARSGAEALADLMGDEVSGAGDLQPSSLRDHREGDELRSIHWRATARRGKPVVREWEGGGGQGLEVVLDRRCSNEELEESLSFLSALVAHARSQKEVLVLHSQDLSASFGEGHRTWDEVLRFLAGAEVLPANAAAPPPTSPAVKRLPARSHA